MSDKVIAVRVNGVTKEVGGSGGGTIGGAYLAPKTVYTQEKLGFSECTVDWDELGEQLTLAGINLDEELINDIEDSVGIGIALSNTFNSQVSTQPLISISVSVEGGEDSGQIYFNTAIYAEDFKNNRIASYYNSQQGGEKPTFTYRTVLEILKNSEDTSSINLPSMFIGTTIMAIGNQIMVHRQNINENEFYNLPNVETFLESILVESGSGSSGSSN